MGKSVVQNVTQLFLVLHVQSLFCTIIHKPRVISQRRLTEGTGAWEAGLIHQRSVTAASPNRRASMIELGLAIARLCLHMMQG